MNCRLIRRRKKQVMRNNIAMIAIIISGIIRLPDIEGLSVM